MRISSVRTLTILMVAIVATLLCVPGLALRAADDGRKTVRVERYGIVVRVPQAWGLISWGRDDQAFGLKLPQDGGNSGHVKCTLVVAPESLEDYQKRLAANATQRDARAGVLRTLVENKIEPIDPERYGAELAKALERRLTTAWEVDGPNDQRTFEICVRVIHNETMYSFSLESDEAHYDAYRLDFEDMLTSAQFTPLETGLQRLGNGFYMQRDFKFALQLPEGWKPAFGPNDRVLFFATGAHHEIFTDNLLVLASPPRPLNLEQLKLDLPGQITRLDAQAQVTCQVVPQRGGAALETVVRTVQGGVKMTILERRFTSGQRNYEIKFTCQSDEFDKHEAELRKSLDSFIEVADSPNKTEA